MNLNLARVMSLIEAGDHDRAHEHLSNRLGIVRNKLDEVNFNDRKLIEQSLNTSIQCGFEAEIVWTQTDDEHSTEPLMTGEIGFEDLEPHMSSEALTRITVLYYDALKSSVTYRSVYVPLAKEWAETVEEEEEFMAQYAKAAIRDAEVVNHRDNTLAGLKREADNGNESAQEDFEDMQIWDKEAWTRDLIDQQYRDDYMQWLIKHGARLYSDVPTTALEQAEQQLPLHVWADRNYTPEQLVRDFNIHVPYDTPRQVVATQLEKWTRNSRYGEVRVGNYQSGQGNPEKERQHYWRVEPDTSIQAMGEGWGVEIISPVYDTPAEMLREMESFFEWLKARKVFTNSSTGLHVTMSMDGDEWETDVNRLKMAVLLGDRYLLDQFNRMSNDYTHSQMSSIINRARQLYDRPEAKSMSDLEELLSQGVRDEKFSSINFKAARNPSGYKLHEFRVAGGTYLEKMDLIRRSVSRYATVMIAGHDPNAFQKEYARALYRTLRLVDQQHDEPDATINPDLMKLFSGILTPAGYANVSPPLRMVSFAERHNIDVDPSVPYQVARAYFWLGHAYSRGHVTKKLPATTVKQLRDVLKRYKVTKSELEDASLEMNKANRIKALDGLRTLLRLPNLTLATAAPASHSVRLKDNEMLYTTNRVLDYINEVTRESFQAKPEEFVAVSMAQHGVLVNGNKDPESSLALQEELGIKLGNRPHEFDWVGSMVVGRESTANKLLELGVKLTVESPD